MSMNPPFPATQAPVPGRRPCACVLAVVLASALACTLLATGPAFAAPTTASPEAASTMTAASTKAASSAASTSASASASATAAASAAASAPTPAVAPRGPASDATCSLRNDARCEAADRFPPIAWGALLYLLIVVTARWQKIAYPTRRLLEAEIEAVLARIAMLRIANGTGTALLVPIESMLRSARRVAGFAPSPRTTADRAADDAAGPSKWQRMLERLYWSRGGEIAAWGLLHEAEEQLVRFQSPEQLRAGLERAAAQLRDIGGTVAAPLADRIEHELQHAVVDIRDPARALLGTVLDGVKPLDTDLLHAVATATPQTVAQVAPKVLALLSGIPATLGDEIRAFLASAAGAASTATPAAYRMLLVEAQALLGAATPPRDALKAAGTDAAALATALAAADVGYLRPAATMAPRLQAALDARATWPIERWRALLVEAQALIYDRGDTDFARLVSWQNKAVWLVTCGLLLMVGLGMALGHLALFLVGAAGGLMSRLSRALHRQDVLTDYGASWSPLFLSPVVGALAGWSGLLLAAVLHQFGILGSLFDALKWDDSLAPLALGLAFVLGFSERAFDSLLGAIDDKIVPPAAGAATAPAPLAIATAALPDARAGQHYEARLDASGGTAPYQWSVTAGKPPAGLAASGAAIAGTPDAAAAGAGATFTVQVTDAKGKTASRAFSITVARATP